MGNDAMARRAFAGDAENRLPKGKVEPYRLWFEYLKLAVTDPSVSVGKKIYARWGNVAQSDFDDWWDSHWCLFSVEAPTRVLTNKREFADTMKDPTMVVLRVSLAEPKRRRIKDINDALARYTLTAQQRAMARRKPLFALSGRRSMNMKTLRGMLKFLQLHRAKGGNIEATSIAYLKWSQNWNEKVKSKKWKRPLVYQPTFLPSFVDQIGKKAGTERTKDERGSYNDLRSQAMRFLRKGNRVIGNVARGQFPGTF